MLNKLLELGNVFFQRLTAANEFSGGLEHKSRTLVGEFCINFCPVEKTPKIDPPFVSPWCHQHSAVRKLCQVGFHSFSIRVTLECQTVHQRHKVQSSSDPEYFSM